MKVTRWFQTGTGNVIITKKLYNEMGRIDEYNTWGKEDKSFYEKMLKKNKPVIREKIKGFHHQWHPSMLEFKNKYACNKEEKIERIRC